jgi:hypothetical protein
MWCTSNYSRAESEKKVIKEPWIIQNIVDGRYLEMCA